MKLWDKLFSRPKSRGSPEPGSHEGREPPATSELYVFWPNGRQQQATIEFSRLDQGLLSNARNILFVLSLQGSATRASLATLRVHTVTPLAFTGCGARVQGVQICAGNDEKLIVAMSIADPADGNETAIALEEGSAKRDIPEADIHSILREIPRAPATVIFAFGPETDPEIDEAYGLAVYLAAALQVPEPSPRHSGSARGSPRPGPDR